MLLPVAVPSGLLVLVGAKSLGAREGGPQLGCGSVCGLKSAIFNALMNAGFHRASLQRFEIGFHLRLKCANPCGGLIHANTCSQGMYTPL